MGYHSKTVEGNDALFCLDVGQVELSAAAAGAAGAIVYRVRRVG